MDWTKDSAKFYVLGAISSMPPLVNEAMNFYSAQFDELQENFNGIMTVLEHFGIDDETFNALNFLQSLPSLPLSYTSDEKTFIDKLNAAVKTVRNNPAVWYNLSNLPHEMWRDVIGYEKLYKVSNYGRLKNLKIRETMHYAKLSMYGYLQCALSKDNRPKRLLVHRLVAQAFLPNSRNKPVVNHKSDDGDTQNNCVWNLEWATYSENVRHAYQTGLMKRPLGEKAANAKLTDEEVRWIRKVCIPRSKDSNAELLAKQFNVSTNTILNVLYRKTYKNVE